MHIACLCRATRLHAYTDQSCADLHALSGMQTYALQRALAKYGIIELARTGKICLKRGEQLLEMGGWGEGIVPRLKSESMKARADASPDAGPVALSSEGDVYDSDSMQSNGLGEQCTSQTICRAVGSLR